MLKTVGNPSSRSGDQTILDGNLVIGTALKGVDFSSSSHRPGMTSELLNDYEEGTWTPTVSAAGGSGSATYVSQEGTYTKVGRLITAIFNITFSKNTLSGGNVLLSGLPFVSNATGFSENYVLIDSLTAPVVSPMLQVSTSSDSALLIQGSGSAGSHSAVPITSLSVSGNMAFRGTITYFA